MMSTPTQQMRTQKTSTHWTGFWKLAKSRCSKKELQCSYISSSSEFDQCPSAIGSEKANLQTKSMSMPWKSSARWFRKKRRGHSGILSCQCSRKPACASWSCSSLARRRILLIGFLASFSDSIHPLDMLYSWFPPQIAASIPGLVRSNPDFWLHFLLRLPEPAQMMRQQMRAMNMLWERKFTSPS